MPRFRFDRRGDCAVTTGDEERDWPPRQAAARRANETAASVARDACVQGSVHTVPGRRNFQR